MRLCRGPLIQVPGLSSKTARGDGTASVPRQCVVRRHADEQGGRGANRFLRNHGEAEAWAWKTGVDDHHRLLLHIAAHHHHLASQQGCRAFIHARDQRCVAPASPY
jgi:hypothetical protein